jgi:hypothetical protein
LGGNWAEIGRRRQFRIFNLFFFNYIKSLPFLEQSETGSRKQETAITQPLAAMTQPAPRTAATGATVSTRPISNRLWLQHYLPFLFFVIVGNFN